MKIYEFGKQNPETIVLLHGGGLSWWNYAEAAKRLEESYHVVIPVLDGHADSEDAFVSIEKNAGRIIRYIEANCGGRILALCGLSLGAQVAVEILHQRQGICRFAMIESASLIPSRLTHLLIGPAVAGSFGLIKQNWFSRLQFRSLHIKESLYEDYVRDTCKLRKSDMIAFMKANTAYALPEDIGNVAANVYVVVGSREQRSMKQSAKLLAEKLPNAELHIMKGLHHGELSLNYPERYAQLLRQMIAKNPRNAVHSEGEGMK